MSVGEDRDKKWAKYEGYAGTHYLAINWIGGGGGGGSINWVNRKK